MAWIESHQTLGRHPKLLKLAGKLRIHRAQALGHLQYLWWWALDYAPTGDVSALAPAEISAASEWQGDPSLFQNSLVECGWIDQDGMIHDWMDYAGRLVDERKRDADRKRMSRIASAGHPADGGRTAPVPNPTLPNSTQPNPTVPNKTVPKEKHYANQPKKNQTIEIPEDLELNRPEIIGWLAYKREKGQGYKQKGLESLWRMIRAIPPGQRLAAIEQSMACNYAGIFPPKGGSNGNQRITGEAGYIPGKYAHLS